MHGDYTLLMSLALDGEATPAEESRLQEHLRTCTACAAIWDRWQILDRRLATAPLVAPPADLVAKVMAQVDERELRRRRARWFGSGLLVSWLGVILLGLAVTATLVILGTRYPQLVRTALAGAFEVIDGIGWLLIGLTTCASNLGAPAIAASVGLLATLTCILGMLWLWIMGHNRTRAAGPFSAAN